MNNKAVYLIFLVVFSSINTSIILADGTPDNIANLIVHIDPNANPFFWDIGEFVKAYLAELKIYVELKYDDGIDWFGWGTRDWDMKFFETQSLNKQDMREYFSEDGFYNDFGIRTEMPYGNDSENMQNALIAMTDLEEQNLYRDEWIFLLMDKIVPLLPLFNSKKYVASWANIEGYEAAWELTHSLPYIEYDGLHSGQESLDELNIVSYNWRELNPLIGHYECDKLISSLISEPLLVFNPGHVPLKTGIIEDWEELSPTHVKFQLRDNIFWNPSFNVTERTATSLPLNSSDTNTLMIGLQNEYSNGTNQKCTAKDAVFSLLAYGNPAVSEKVSSLKWLSDCYVDPVDDTAFHIKIDGNPDTPEIEVFSDFWLELDRPILPEFFLNSSSLDIYPTVGGIEHIGLYPGIVQTAQWREYSTSAFGLGKYMLNYHIRNLITTLERNPNWFNLGAIDGTVQDLDISTVNIHVSSDKNAQILEFMDGKIDLIDVTNFPSEREDMQMLSAFTVSPYSSYDFSYLAFNLRRPFVGGVDNDIFLNRFEFSNYTLGTARRKAMCYAIDKEKINEQLFEDQNIIVHSPVPVGFTYYGPDMDPIQYDYDLEMAKMWLDLALNNLITDTNYTWLSTCLILGTLAFAISLKKKREKKIN